MYYVDIWIDKPGVKDATESMAFNFLFHNLEGILICTPQLLHVHIEIYINEAIINF